MARRRCRRAGQPASSHRSQSAGYLGLPDAGRHPRDSDDARRAVAEAVRQKSDIDQEQVRRSYRYRDPERLERVIAVLNAAGLPA